jgi:hypothetical protein
MEHGRLPLTKWYLAIYLGDAVENEYRSRP